jgi:hypothetical protein
VKAISKTLPRCWSKLFSVPVNLQFFDYLRAELESSIPLAFRIVLDKEPFTLRVELRVNLHHGAAHRKHL